MKKKKKEKRQQKKNRHLEMSLLISLRNIKTLVSDRYCSACIANADIIEDSLGHSNWLLSETKDCHICDNVYFFTLA